MARRINARDIGRLKPGLYRFDPTLYLRVLPAGSRAWTQRIRVHGRPVEKGLGGWPVVGVEEARLQALSNRRAVRAGQDPFRKVAAAPTFARAAEETRAARASTWAASSLKTFDSLMRAVLPILGSVPVGKVSKSHVIDCLTSINRRSTSTARKAKKAISTVLELAVSRDWASINVAKNGGLDAALPFLRETGSHHAAADPNAVGRMLATLGTSTAADAIRFAVLTATRASETRNAEWSEFDLAAATWTIPADRMKAGREHRVPLSPAALAIVQARFDARASNDRFVFHGRETDKPMADTTMNRPLKPFDGVTLHGFRATFATWAAATGRDREAREHALAHAVGSTVERCYQRSDLFDRRRELMNAWAEFLGV